MNGMKLKHENNYAYYRMTRFNYNTVREFKYSIYEVISLTLGIISLSLEFLSGVIINKNNYINISNMPIESFSLILSLMLYGFIISIVGLVIGLIDFKDENKLHKLFLPSIICNLIVFIEGVVFIIINIL